jgi:hypothetical protein
LSLKSVLGLVVVLHGSPFGVHRSPTDLEANAAIVEHGKRTIPLPRLLEEAKRDAPHIAERRTPNAEDEDEDEDESREREKRVSDWQPTTEN